MVSSSSPVFREEQPWRTSPPMLVVTLLGTAGAWLLFIWIVVLGRSLGNTSVPSLLAWILLLVGGIIFPLSVLTLKQTVEVYPDHIFIKTSPFSRYTIPFAEIVRVEPLLRAALKEYTNRSIGSGQGTRTAYTVMGDQGVELERRDGSHILIGSGRPEELAAAITSVWTPPPPRAAA